MRASLRYSRWYGELPVDPFAIGFVALVTVTFVALVSVATRRLQQFAEPLFLYGLLVGTIAVNVLQFHLIQTPYLDERTALSFYVLTGFALASFGKVIALRRALVTVWSTTVLICAPLLFLSAANFKKTYQWWFNENDREVLTFIETQRVNASGTVSLDCNWMFHPSINFYVQTQSLTWLNLKPFHSELDTASNADYYYTMWDEKEKLLDRYRVVRDYEHQRFLLQRNENEK